MHTPVTTGRCLYRAERAYVDDADIGHDVLHAPEPSPCHAREFGRWAAAPAVPAPCGRLLTVAQWNIYYARGYAAKGFASVLPAGKSFTEGAYWGPVTL